MKIIYLILVVVTLNCTVVLGQITPPVDSQDTIVTEQEEVIIERNQGLPIEEIETYNNQFIPRKASLYSAILPGAGQVYNKKYWKVPIVYGGFIALGYAVNFYNDSYQLFRSELFTTLEGDYTSPYGSEEQLRSNIDRRRRDRDFYIIMIGVLYFLQVADAHIDAHLKEFDLNPDLKVSIEPSFENSQYFGYSTGVSIKFKF